jgi:UDP-N-acetyl-D-glucosamine/UDP-N-acetyl-D-galactosamine dehydrogenase
VTFDLKNARIAVIGLGYVGMPLAVALAKYNTAFGYDINTKRVADLRDGHDSNREISQTILRSTTCVFTENIADIADCNVFIVTVPTPIDEKNDPDLGAVKAASKAVAGILKKGDIVCYESTVYPGVTEDVCGVILEAESGLKCGVDFFLGYSPERINPGDTEHTVENITKVVAGQTQDVADFLVQLYGQMNGGRIYKAANIKTAEASKAIENAQRDINVAFINEVTMILNKMGLSAYDVIEAAKTKWNFLHFTPGLVGGHCIGVDPYYLAKSAIDVGQEPQVILAGRKTNDNMGAYVASRINLALKEKSSDILILGFTFKENINDIRNTKVIDTIRTLQNFGHRVDIHDPHAYENEAEHEYGIKVLSSMPKDKKYDAVCLMVPHVGYKEMGAAAILKLLSDDHGAARLIFDLKGIWRHIDLSNEKISYVSL